jgi:hypothetical protein
MMLVALVALFCVSVHAQNLLVNGDFTSDLSGWTTTNDVTSDQYLANPATAGWFFAGPDVAVDGCSTAGVAGNCLDPVLGDVLSQTTPTISGEYYYLSFTTWNTPMPIPGPALELFWDGSEIDYSYTSTPVEFDYTLIGSGDDTLSFTGFDTDGQVSLSSVSLIDSGNSVPEPNACVLFGTVLVFCCGKLRKRISR